MDTKTSLFLRHSTDTDGGGGNSRINDSAAFPGAELDSACPLDPELFVQNLPTEQTRQRKEDKVNEEHTGWHPTLPPRSKQQQQRDALRVRVSLIDIHDCSRRLVVIASVEQRGCEDALILRHGDDSDMQVLACLTLKTLSISRYWGLGASKTRIVELSDGPEQVHLELEDFACLQALETMCCREFR